MIPVIHQMLRGELDLEFAVKRGKTRLLNSYQVPPLRASRPLYTSGEGAATVYLVDTSGGMASGDKNNIHVHVQPEAAVHVKVQSSTKIYPARLDHPVTEQTITLDLKENSRLFWHPETTIPYADARFKQKINVFLEPSSTFYFADILSPGREKHRELFQYDTVDTSFSICLNRKCIAFDRQTLQPGHFSEASIGMLDEFSYYGSAWFISPAFTQSLREIQSRIQVDANMRFGVTQLDPVGVHARWLSKDLCLLKESMSAFYELVTAH